jgi:hypothetical protein
LTEDAEVLIELLMALLGVVEDNLLLELLLDVSRDSFGVVLITGVVVLTVVFCAFAEVFAVVFAVVFVVVVFTMGLDAGFVVGFTTRTTGNSKASFMSCEACEMQLQAAVSSSEVIPRTADVCLWLQLE